LPLSLLSPLKSSLHRYHLLSLSRKKRGAYAFGAIVIFKMIQHAVQINKRAYICYIYIYNCDRCLRYDENDTIMMIQNAIEVAPVYPLVVEAIRSMNARRLLNMCERAKNELKDFPIAYTNFHGPSTFRITVLCLV